MKHILKCPKCNSYSLHESCPCGGHRVSPKPAKFIVDDKYAHYKREAKRLATEDPQ